MKLFSEKRQNSNNNGKAEYNREPEKTEESVKPKKKGKGVLIALIVIAAIIGGLALYWVITTAPPEIEPTPPGEEAPAIDSEITEEARYYTLMLVGEDQEGFNTDTIMVVRFDALELKADIVSIPRDTLVNISENVKKINGVFHSAADGGIDRLKAEIKKIAGFTPNNYVVVNIEAFEKIIDAVGGIWFDVPQDMHYTHYSATTGEPFVINISKGPQLLNGHDALSVWRYRQNDDGTGYPGGDLQRISVQHDLLYAIAAQIMDLGISDWGKLLNIIQIGVDYCETDLLVKNIQWYAQKFLKMGMEDINIQTAPVTGCMINASHPASYVTLDVEAWMEMVNACLNPYETEIKAEDCVIVYSDEKTLYNGFLYIDPKDLEVTDGSQAYKNFY